MINRFKDPMMRQAYDACIGNAHKGLFGINEGQQCKGSSHATAFWDGYNGDKTAMHNPDDPAFRKTLGYAAYRAGQDYAKEI